MPIANKYTKIKKFDAIPRLSINISRLSMPI